MPADNNTTFFVSPKLGKMKQLEGELLSDTLIEWDSSLRTRPSALRRAPEAGYSCWLSSPETVLSRVLSPPGAHHSSVYCHHLGYHHLSVTP